MYALTTTSQITESQERRAAELVALDWVHQGIEPAPRNGVVKLVSPSGRMIAWVYSDHTHRQVA